MHTYERRGHHFAIFTPDERRLSRQLTDNPTELSRLTETIPPLTTGYFPPSGVFPSRSTLWPLQSHRSHGKLGVLGSGCCWALGGAGLWMLLALDAAGLPCAGADGAPAYAASMADRPSDVALQKLGVAPGLCAACAHARLNETRRGTAYLRCARAAWDAALPRYPRLPVAECTGFEPSDEPSAPCRELPHRRPAAGKAAGNWRENRRGPELGRCQPSAFGR
jgi:hypothetical protein